MLRTYIQCVFDPLKNALIIAGLVFCTSVVSNIVTCLVIPLLLIQLSTQSLLSSFLRQRLLQGFFYRATAVLVNLMAFIITLVFMALLYPHLLLFFNALPWAFSITFFTISSFLISFEFNIRVPGNNLGPEYSLVKLLLNPRTQFEVLRQTLIQRQNYYEVQPNANIPPSQINLNREVGVGDEIRKKAKSLQLSEANRNQLVDRQKAAIKALPKNAIIDDLGLYKKNLETERKSGTRKPNIRTNSKLDKPSSGSEWTTDIQTAQQDAAREKSKAEAERLETQYLSSLSQPQQNSYREYRDFIKYYSLPYAECMITMEDVVSNPKEFIIMEKRRLQSNKEPPSCFTGKTFIWHHKEGFLRFFTMRPDDVPEEPSSRDKFFLINDTKSGYEYHTYEMVDGHPLSLQLCEIIEKLTPILSPSATKSSKNGPFFTPSVFAFFNQNKTQETQVEEETQTIYSV